MTQEQSKKTWAIYKQIVPGEDKWERAVGGFETVQLAERHYQQTPALHGLVVRYVEEEE